MSCLGCVLQKVLGKWLVVWGSFSSTFPLVVDLHHGCGFLFLQWVTVPYCHLLDSSDCTSLAMGAFRLALFSLRSPTMP